MKNFSAIFLLAVAIGSVVGASIDKPFSTVDFDHFWTLDEINEYLAELLEHYPELTTRQTFGQTSEGRNIDAFIIRRGIPTATIIVEAGLRPREWLSPMAAIYFIHEIVEHYYEFDDILNSGVQIVFLPVANPDGYVFTHSSPANRFWNKNRRAVGSGCFGVDLNRNFQFSFATFNDPCSENYPGLNSFSELESQAIRSVLVNFQYTTRMYLSLQAFGQQISFPYNSLSLPSSRESQFVSLANSAAAAIFTAPANRLFQVGSGFNLQGVEHGTSLDFAYGNRAIPLAFAIKLPRGGTTGWDVPANQLHSMLGESFRGFLVFVRHVVNA